MSQAEMITLVGAGPVGSLLALTLAQRGLHVEVYERRPDMRTQALAAGRSINLAVSTRGLTALRAVGLEQAVLDQAVSMRGRMTHARDGALALLPYGRDETECIHSMSRGDLNKQLMTAAEATGRVQLRFGHKLTGYDFATRRARFQLEGSGGVREVEAPVLIGTDGSASALREALAQGPDFHATVDTLDAGYKELTIPPDPRGMQGRFAIEPHALHIWPRGQFMLIALPNRDGSFTCTLFLPLERRGEVPGFAELQTAAHIDAFFAEWFADAAPLLPDLAAQFLAAPLGHMATVKCWPWQREGALLLGDAAHAIVPFFGQGMNCGFEDCTVLAGLLDAQPGPVDWPGLFARVAQERKPDTDAIADLAVENFVEMRDKVADPTFLLHRAVEGRLQQRLGHAYRSRYQLVTFTNLPYRVALEAGRRQAAVLAEACEGRRSVDAVDLDGAEARMRAELLPFLRDAGLT
jgi:kynurenine 3-monooxygenase